MIEVPPPHSFEGRTLHYGAMTCGQYIWFRSKWAFAACGFTGTVSIWEFTIGTWWSVFLGIVLLASVAVNLFVAYRWRYSWAFWHLALYRWLDRQEHFNVRN